MEKRIQISRELYEMMGAYVNDHYDPDDSRYLKIIRGINEKAEKMDRHLAYTKYKTCQEPEAKERARIKYLDNIGMHKDYRW